MVSSAVEHLRSQLLRPERNTCTWWGRKTYRKPSLCGETGYVGAGKAGANEQRGHATTCPDYEG